MRRYRKWVLALGLMTAAPSFGQAGPLPGPSTAPGMSGGASASDNQRVANQIQSALQSANVGNTHPLGVQVVNGVATLSGTVSHPGQAQQIASIVSRVPGVTRVQNNLVPEQTGAPAMLPGPQGAPGVSNQQMAERVRDALGRGGVRGDGVAVGFMNGRTTLTGTVATPAERALAEQVAMQVPGVRFVENNLSLRSAGPGRDGNVMPASYQPMSGQGAPQMIPPSGSLPPEMQPMGGPYGPAMAAPGVYGPPPAMMAPPIPPGAVDPTAVYNQPNLPPHAWPTYANYPNYAQVTYPSQYSASAWPYMGPFYPYPQVPLGWRKATLEWDDGHWNLAFSPRTDKWWWFLHPENWDDSPQ